MTLGKPTRGLSIEKLQAEPGKGNSITLFAGVALEDWAENIPMPGFASRTDRRELICHLSKCSFLHPLDMMAVILLKQREYRAQNRARRSAA